jgi:hypothetical protein
MLSRFYPNTGEPSKDDLKSFKTTFIKLLQEGIRCNLISQMGDNTDISIAKRVWIGYIKDPERLMIEVPSPWKEEINEILRSGAKNENR